MSAPTTLGKKDDFQGEVALTASRELNMVSGLEKIAGQNQVYDDVLIIQPEPEDSGTDQAKLYFATNDSNGDHARQIYDHTMNLDADAVQAMFDDAPKQRVVIKNDQGQLESDTIAVDSSNNWEFKAAQSQSSASNKNQKG